MLNTTKTKSGKMKSRLFHAGKTILILILTICNLQFATTNLFAQGATCATSTVLSLGSCTGVSQTITDPVLEATTPALSCMGAGVFRREGWYSFTTTGATNITVTATSTSITTNLAIQILSGTCGTPLTEIGCGNVVTTSCAQTETVTAAIAAAGTFYFRIINLGTAVNMVMNNICLNFTPTNNDCPGFPLAVASACIINTTTYGTLEGASQTSTVSPCTSAGCTAVQDVWYNFTAISTTQLITISASSMLNIAFQVFSTSCNGISINCTDSFNTLGATETTTLVGLTPGTTYWIRVYCASAGIPSTTTFAITIETPPSNDDCIGATYITSMATCAGATTGCDYLATDSGVPVAASCSTSSAEDDVWYMFTATATCHTITVSPSTAFDAVFELLTGTCGGLGGFTSLGCVGSGGAPGVVQAQAFTGLTIGSIYYVRVYDYDSVPPATNYFTICITNCTVGITQSELNNQNSEIQIAPNPSNGLFTITTNSTKISSIIIEDITGRKISDYTFNNTTIDLSNCSDGIYFIHIFDENKNAINKKIIKQ